MPRNATSDAGLMAELMDARAKLTWYQIEESKREWEDYKNSFDSQPGGEAREKPEPVGDKDRTKNPLRPRSFDEMVGQEAARRMLEQITRKAAREKRPLDHVLLVGPSGTGKSTFSHVIACELDVDVYEVEAPIDHETLLDLREVMQDRDILRIEEIHQQAIMERRGRGAGTEPEVLYNILEDRTITSGSGILSFPEITVVGTTTDEGMLPEPFLNRFPLRPRLAPYTTEQLAELAEGNARALGLKPDPEAMKMFSGASRGVPRQINNYVKNAVSLAEDSKLSVGLAERVLTDLNGVTLDGLTPDMANFLIFLLTKGKHVNSKGEVIYKSSLASIATGIGKSRDVKALTLRVEPWLIEQGLIQVTHGGRCLSPTGIERAQQLLEERRDG